MASIRLYLRNRPDRHGLCEIVMIYRNDEKETYLTTGKKCPKMYWDNKSVHSWVKPDYGNGAMELNMVLRKLRGEAEEKMNRFFLLNNRYPLGDEMRDLTQDKKDRHSFFAVFDEFMKERKDIVSAGTYKNYKKFKKRFEDYQTYNGTPFTFHSINHGFHTHFTNYLIRKHESQANTIGSYFRILKAFLRWAELHKRIEIDRVVMANMHVLREQNFYVWLTLDEIDKINALDFGNKVLLTRCRDAFVFQCMVGCRYGDLEKLVRENIVFESGVYYMKIKTRKNEKLIKVPLAKKAVAIIEKYKGISVADWLPTMQECNSQIKEVCKLAGMYEVVQMVRGSGDNRKEHRFQKWQLITTHCARRSAVNNLKAAGISDHVIASITGQSISTIQGYKHADTQDVLKAITVFDRPAPESKEAGVPRQPE